MAAVDGPTLLRRLQEALWRLEERALNTIKRQGRSRRPRNSTTPQEINYPTETYVLVQQLLQANYIGGFIEQELLFDGGTVTAANHLLETLRIFFDEREEVHCEFETLEGAYLPDRKPDRLALRDALKSLQRAVKQCRTSYGALPDLLRRTAAKAMQQELWPQIGQICDAFSSVNSGMERPLNFRCCKTKHEARVCVTSPACNASPCRLRLQIQHGLAWYPANLMVDRFTASRRNAEPIRSVCEMINENQQSLVLIDNGRNHETYFTEGGQDSQSKPVVQMVSLREWIRGDFSVSFDMVDRRVRTVLALMLAYYYLHLGGTPLWSDREVLPNVWFELTSTSGQMQLHRPSLTLCHRRKVDDSGISAEEVFNNAERPSLPALGKLLLEVWLGRPLSWDQVQTLPAELESANDDIGTIYFTAVSRCWGSNRIRSGGQLCDDKEMFDEYASWVVKGLQYILKELYQVHESDIFGMNGDTLCSVTFKMPEGTSCNHKAVSNVHKACLSKSSTTPRLQESKESYGRRSDGTENLESDVEEISALDKQKSKVQDLNNLETSELCFHEDGTSGPVDQRLKVAADSWMQHLKTKVHPFLKSLRRSRRDAERVKVAILDTGATFDRTILEERYSGRIAEYRTWCEAQEDPFGREIPHGGDSDGHGTQITSALLDVAPQCRVYIAKIAESRTNKDRDIVTQSTQRSIAFAIKYASEIWNVDVISMSFGFDNRSILIQHQIEKAAQHNVLMLAAASNYGALRRITFPATHKDVICVHAMTGFGNVCDSTPSSLDSAQNFATLGSAVRTWSIAGKEVYSSGSSIATPIAAGIAASVIEVMRCAKQSYLERCADDRIEIETARYDRCLLDLCSKAGMAAVFKMIVGDTGKRYGYGFLTPWSLLHESVVGHATTLIDNIVRAVEEST